MARAMIITQVLAELYRCSPAIDEEDALIGAARAAAHSVGASIVGEHAVRYVPHGLTVALFLAESHIVLTTWPEHRLLLVDILLCNPEMDYRVAIGEIARRLCPDGQVVTHDVPRRIAAAHD
jgi:S-adenosylmethionine decarboxylase